MILKIQCSQRIPRRSVHDGAHWHSWMRTLFCWSRTSSNPYLVRALSDWLGSKVSCQNLVIISVKVGAGNHVCYASTPEASMNPLMVHLCCERGLVITVKTGRYWCKLQRIPCTIAQIGYKQPCYAEASPAQRASQKTRSFMYSLYLKTIEPKRNFASKRSWSIMLQ